jgi:hypothetical protein
MGAGLGHSDVVATRISCPAARAAHINGTIGNISPYPGAMAKRIFTTTSLAQWHKSFTRRAVVTRGDNSRSRRPPSIHEFVTKLDRLRDKL